MLWARWAVDVVDTWSCFPCNAAQSEAVAELVIQTNINMDKDQSAGGQMGGGNMMWWIGQSIQLHKHDIISIYDIIAILGWLETVFTSCIC